MKYMGTFLQSLLPNFRSSSLPAAQTASTSGISLTDTEATLIRSIRRHGYERVFTDYLNLTDNDISEIYANKKLTKAQQVLRLIQNSEFSLKSFITKLYMKWEESKKHNLGTWKNANKQYHLDNIRRLVKQEKIDFEELIFEIFKLKYKSIKGVG